MGIKIEELVGYLFGGFLLIQVFSIITSMIFPSVPIIKLGYAFFLIIIFVAVYSVFALAQRRFEIKNTMEFLVILLAAAALVFLIIQLPKLIPQIFSTIQPDIFSEGIKELQSIVPILR